MKSNTSPLSLILLNPRAWVGCLGLLTLLGAIVQPTIAQAADGSPEASVEDQALETAADLIAEVSTSPSESEVVQPASSDTVTDTAREESLGNADASRPVEASIPGATAADLESSIPSSSSQSGSSPSSSSPSALGESNSGQSNSGQASPSESILGESITDPSISDSSVSATTPLQILSPTPNEVLPRPAATVVIQALADSLITLTANGQPVDSNQVGQVTVDGASGLMRQMWYGVSLREGENVLTVTATLPDGTVQTTQQTVGSASKFGG
jgi:hypothetical protein